MPHPADRPRCRSRPCAKTPCAKTPCAKTSAGPVAAAPPVPPRSLPIDREFSACLDLLRSVAALLVFAHHILLQFGCYRHGACGFAGFLLPQHSGHIAVILFFVLSGYVITYVASERERTLIDFAISRFARVYSVAIPAILLVMCVDILLISVRKTAGIPVYQYQGLWKYLPVFLTFTTDFWFIGESTFSDVPFWSLCYEVWYYAIFAAVFFGPRRNRWACALPVFLLVGPKLWVLLPIWAMGSRLYGLHRKLAIGVMTARIVLGLTAAVLILTIIFDLTGPVDHWVDRLSGGWISHHLRFSQWFAGDTIVAVVFAAHMFAAKYARLGFGRLTAPIRILASFSFTLYLTHWPLLEFWRGYVGLDMPATIFAVLCGVGLLGLFTEHQKDRLRDRLRELCNGRALRVGA
jgi:peptidoglycan/LPS O-acetylase OafA/YrhL